MIFPSSIKIVAIVSDNFGFMKIVKSLVIVLEIYVFVIRTISITLTENIHFLPPNIIVGKLSQVTGKSTIL